MHEVLLTEIQSILRETYVSVSRRCHQQLELIVIIMFIFFFKPKIFLFKNCSSLVLLSCELKVYATFGLLFILRMLLTLLLCVWAFLLHFSSFNLQLFSLKFMTVMILIHIFSGRRVYSIMCDVIVLFKAIEFGWMWHFIFFSFVMMKMCVFYIF